MGPTASSRAERAAKRAAQVRTSFPRRLAATGSAARDVQLQSLHQLREFGELSLAELGEALRPQQLSRARERDFLLDDADVTNRRVRLEHAAKDAVVDRDLLRPRDERQSARPIQVLRRQHRSCAAELNDAAGSRGKAFLAQCTRERGQPLDLVSH